MAGKMELTGSMWTAKLSLEMNFLTHFSFWKLVETECWSWMAGKIGLVKWRAEISSVGRLLFEK